MSAKTYRSLTAHQRALVAMAVLLDGSEAATFLASDIKLGEVLRQAVEELTRDELEVRLPFVGTLFREALVEMSNDDND